MIRNRATAKIGVPMTLEEVRRQAPSVFSDHPWEGVSSKYTFIPTISVLEPLLKEGWEITKAEQQRCNLPDKTNFTRHVIRLRQGAAPLEVGDVFPEIVLINSHDRGSAYRMHAGFFRLACTNGLIVDDASFLRLAIRHSGRVIEEVRKSVDEVISHMPRLIGNVKQMQEMELSEGERYAFARSAVALRFDEGAIVDPQRLLVTHRRSDDKKDLFTTFNIVQENMIGGGVRYRAPQTTTAQGRVRPARDRHTRGIKAIQEDTRINKALWTLAEEMKRLKMN